ncbi:hypothetical protein JL721_9034 [Aureococcus anophagefferens]|nr:hypothetical protein JL721_9034 [Aureococcus anophagefferens]
MDVRVYVDVKLGDGMDGGALLRGILQGLGATVYQRWSATARATHLVWKNGDGRTLEEARARGVAIVGLAWVNASQDAGGFVPAAPYALRSRTVAGEYLVRHDLATTSRKRKHTPKAFEAKPCAPRTCRASTTPVPVRAQVRRVVGRQVAAGSLSAFHRLAPWSAVSRAGTELPEIIVIDDTPVPEKVAVDAAPPPPEDAEPESAPTPDDVDDAVAPMPVDDVEPESAPTPPPDDVARRPPTTCSSRSRAAAAPSSPGLGPASLDDETWAPPDAYLAGYGPPRPKKPNALAGVEVHVVANALGPAEPPHSALRPSSPPPGGSVALRAAVALVGESWTPCKAPAALRALHRNGHVLRVRWLFDAIEHQDPARPQATYRVPA